MVVFFVLFFLVFFKKQVGFFFFIRDSLQKMFPLNLGFGLWIIHIFFFCLGNTMHSSLFCGLFMGKRCWKVILNKEAIFYEAVVSDCL